MQLPFPSHIHVVESHSVSFLTVKLTFVYFNNKRQTKHPFFLVPHSVGFGAASRIFGGSLLLTVSSNPILKTLIH